ncbi:hypothetical protein PTKIN_Ptkin04bG0188100 [Pterospermum kingtungense]
MDRRLARSPAALRSPVLSPKSPAIYERYKSGCAWGLIHFFDFRQDHSHGKLISYKKRSKRPTNKADGNTRNKPNFISSKKAQDIDDAHDNKNQAVNSRKQEVKKVTEEEVSVKHQTKRNDAVEERQNLQSNPKLIGHSKDHRKANKSSKKSSPFPANGCDAATEGYRQPSDQNSIDKSSNSNFASVKETSAYVHANNGGNYSRKIVRGRKHDLHTEINLEVHMNEAVEAFVNQKLNDGENLSINEVANRSKNFIGALEILNSNKELFMKLLQDPNSLLVKHIQDFRDSQGKKQQPQSSSKAKTSQQCQPKEVGEREEPEDAQTLESCDRCLSNGSDIPQPLNSIVVLKAGTQNCPDRMSNWPSPKSHYSLRKRGRSVRPAFLSFEHMKRKLRHAMRGKKKEKCQMSLDDINTSSRDFELSEDGSKKISRQANERLTSASKSYQDVEKMSKSSSELNTTRDGMGQKDNLGSSIGSKAASSTESCERTSNQLTARHLKGKFHPRQHLSDLLNRENEDLSRKQTLRVLDRLVSLPEYDLLPRLTPGRDKEHGFPSPEMRFSPYSSFSTIKKEKRSYLTSPIKNSEAQPVSRKEKPDDRLQGAKKSIFGDTSPATEVPQTVCSLADDLSHKVNQTSAYPGKVMERNHPSTWDKCKSNALEVTLEPKGLENANTNQRTQAVNRFGESGLNSPSGDQTSSSSIDVYSSSPSCIHGAEYSDSSMIDRAEQPSPVSVLDQLFIEDNTSSPSSLSLAAEPPVEPFCIDIEELPASSLLESHLELKSNAGSSIDKQGYMSKCIRAALQISGLNWDELSTKWHLSDQLLDSTLFDNVEVWPEKSCTDHRLFSEYMTEVLSEIYRCHFGCSPWVSLLNPRPRPALLSKNMVHEVLRHIDWQLLSELPQQSLHELVEKDLAKPGTWMDIQLDTEEVVTELADSILDDLVVDVALRLQT